MTVGAVGARSVEVTAGLTIGAVIIHADTLANLATGSANSLLRGAGGAGSLGGLGGARGLGGRRLRGHHRSRLWCRRDRWWCPRWLTSHGAAVASPEDQRGPRGQATGRRAGLPPPTVPLR